MKKVLILIALLAASSPVLASKSYFHLYVGQDNPDDGETRTASANMLKLELTNGLRFFRFSTGFTYMRGASQFSQGELTVGPYIYPLGGISKTPAQPFIFALGKIGFGTLEDTSRMDTGYGLGAGVDMNVFDRSGFTIAVEQHNATETATRLWAGFFWR